MINPFFFCSRSDQSVQFNKNFKFKFLKSFYNYVNVKKKTISLPVPCEVQLKRSHLNGRTCFSSISPFFLPGSQWSYGFFWFLNLKWFPTSYWHHHSLVSCFCGSCSPQRLVHVLVEDHKTQENYMYKNHDNRKSHEKYQPWESGKPGITESHRAKETKRTWEPQVTET